MFLWSEPPQHNASQNAIWSHSALLCSKKERKCQGGHRKRSLRDLIEPLFWRPNFSCHAKLNHPSTSQCGACILSIHLTCSSLSPMTHLHQLCHLCEVVTTVCGFLCCRSCLLCRWRAQRIEVAAKLHRACSCHKNALPIPQNFGAQLDERSGTKRGKWTKFASKSSSLEARCARSFRVRQYLRQFLQKGRRTRTYLAQSY